MKKIIISCVLLLSAMTASVAQKISYDPPVPDPDLPLTVIIDLEATENTTLAGLPGEPDIFLWTWIDGTSATYQTTNGSWGTSDDRNKMTKVGTTGKKYSFTYGPTLKAYFKVSESDMWGYKLGCLAKGKDGGGTPENKTEDMLVTIPAPVTGRQLMATHPLKVLDTLRVTSDDIVTFIYNNSLDTLPYMHNPPLGPDDVALFTRVYFSDGSPVINYSPPANYDSNPALSMQYISDGEYRLSFIPSQFFTAAGGVTDQRLLDKFAAGYYIQKVSMRVVKKRAAAGTINPLNGPPAYEFGLLKP